MTAILDELDRIELGLCLRVNRYANGTGTRRFFAAISRLGDGYGWALFAPALYVVHGNAVFDDILRMGVTAAVGLLVYRALKGWLVRERPYISHAGIRCGTAALDRYSFPSGHTLHATSFTVMIGDIDGAFLLLALPFAILIAASRTILGLHYPSDVVAGAAIGLALSLASISLF